MEIIVFLIAFVVTILVHLPYDFACYKKMKSEERARRKTIVRISDMLIIIVAIVLSMYTSSIYIPVIIGIVCGLFIRFIMLRSK